MKRFKHYSFDLWHTLIKPNPIFASEIRDLFFKKYNPENKSVEEVANIIYEVERTCKESSRLTGQSISSDQINSFILIGLNYTAGNPKVISELYREIETIFMQYPPEFYDENTVETLKELKKPFGTTMSILSNTGFVTGKTIVKWLDTTALKNMFNFKVFSGDQNVCKPNTSLFLLMIYEAAELAKPEYLKTDDIIHVGNNQETDINPANEVKINSLKINTGDITIKNLLLDQ